MVSSSSCVRVALVSLAAIAALICRKRGESGGLSGLDELLFPREIVVGGVADIRGDHDVGFTGAQPADFRGHHGDRVVGDFDRGDGRLCRRRRRDRHRDHDGGAERAGHIRRHRVGHPAVDQRPALDRHGHEDTGDGRGGVHGARDRAAVEDHRRAGPQVGRHRGEGQRHLLDVPVLQALVEEFLEPVALDEAAGEDRQRLVVEEVLVGDRERGKLQVEALAGVGVEGADQAADRGADDDVDRDLLAFENPDDADLGEPAGARRRRGPGRPWAASRLAAARPPARRPDAGAAGESDERATTTRAPPRRAIRLVTRSGVVQ